MRFVDELIGVIESPQEFFDTLSSVRIENFKSKEEDYSKLLIELNKNHNVDFCDIGYKAIIENYDCWSIRRSIQPAFADFTLNIDSTINLIKFASEKGKCNITVLITQLYSKQPKFVSELLSTLIQFDEPFIIDYVANINISLSVNHFEETYENLIKQTAHKSLFLQQGAIYALGNLDYSEKDNSILINTIEVLTSKMESKSFDVLRFIAISFGNLLKYSDIIPSKLFKLKDMDIDEINYEISFILFKESKDHNKKDWFRDLLMLFIDTPDESINIIRNLDYAISDLVKSNDNNFVFNFLNNWFSQKKRVIKNAKFKTQFDSILDALTDNQKLLENIITQFFNNDNYVFHNIASQILEKNYFQTQIEIQMDCKVLTKLNYNDHMFICRKIIGYVFDNKTICSLLFSFLNLTTPENKTKDLIYSFFLYLLAINDPPTTKTFFENKLKNEGINESQKHLCTIGIDMIQKHFDSLTNLPILKEFVLPQKYYYQANREKNIQMNKTMGKKENQPVLFQFITKTPLKFGRGWFTYNEQIEDYSNISYLSKVSHSITFPFSEISYPVDNSLLRFNFRVAKREKI